MLKTDLSIMPGDRVMVYDSSLFKNDIDTPVSMITKPATVICRYGKQTRYQGDETPTYYEDLCDVLFDHRSESVSHGHFTYYIDKID